MNRYHVMKTNQLFPYYQVLSIKNNYMSFLAGSNHSYTTSDKSSNPLEQNT